MGKKDGVECRLEILEKELQRIKTLYERTLGYRENDPETAMMHARKAAEAICRQLFVSEINANPGNLMLDGLIEKLTAAGVLPKNIALPLRTIQGYGNFASHEQDDNTRTITTEYIQPCLQALAIVVDWYIAEHKRYGVDGGDRKSLGIESGEGVKPSASEKPEDGSRGESAVGKTSGDGSMRLRDFADARGLTPSAVIRMAREVLHLELRTPSALLAKAQIESLETALLPKQTDSSGTVVAPPLRSFDLGGGVTMDFVLINSGRFRMGSPITEEGHNDDEIEHEVEISRSFYMGRYLVTQQQYDQIGGVDPSYFLGNDLPVEMTSWFDAVSFCEVLSERYGRQFRLPTEAEWEYACRAGTTTAFSFGGTITPDQANFDGKFGVPRDAKAVSRWTTTAVSTFSPNAWGLYDMHGNVWEWCSDWYGEYPANSAKDPAGPKNGDIRILRGGSWFHGVADARSAQRDALDPGRRHSIYGFRVVLEGGREQ